MSYLTASQAVAIAKVIDLSQRTAKVEFVTKTEHEFHGHMRGFIGRTDDVRDQPIRLTSTTGGEFEYSVSELAELVESRMLREDVY